MTTTSPINAPGQQTLAPPGDPTPPDSIPSIPSWQNRAQREPTANLTLRVRQHLDSRLARQVFELNQHGWHTSKVEIIEMLLFEMPDQLDGDLVARLQSFRSAAPRNT